MSFINSKHTELLYKTLQVYSLRNEVIQNNIANVDTPGFKKSSVKFEEALSGALGKNKLKDIDLNGINPSVSVVNEGYEMRMDGNNVDIDAENVQLYVNAIRTDAVANAISANSKIKNMAVMGRV